MKADLRVNDVGEHFIILVDDASRWWEICFFEKNLTPRIDENIRFPLSHMWMQNEVLECKNHYSLLCWRGEQLVLEKYNSIRRHSEYNALKKGTLDSRNTEQILFFSRAEGSKISTGTWEQRLKHSGKRKEIKGSVNVNWLTILQIDNTVQDTLRQVMSAEAA